MIFDAKWFEKNQKKIIWLANNPILKYWFRYCLRINEIPTNTKINYIAPDNYSYDAKEINGKVRLKTNFRTFNKYAVRMRRAFYPLWFVLHITDLAVINNFCPKYNLGYDILTQYPNVSGAVDGYLERSGIDETLAVIRVGAGTAVGKLVADSTCAGLQATSTNDQFGTLRRASFTFYTESIAGSTINSVDFALKGTGKANGLGEPSIEVVASTQADPTDLVASDFSNVGATSFASNAYADFTTAGSYTIFSLNATGISAASSDTDTYGFVGLSTRTSWDLNNSFTGIWASMQATYFSCFFADQAGQLSDPYISVDYTAPASGFIPQVIIF